MPLPLDQLDYYALLGVAPDAGLAQIKAAFRAFAREYHPDRYRGDAQRLAEATRIYLRATEAYRVLSHPRQRALYDAQRAAGSLRLDPQASVGLRSVPPRRDGVHARARPFLVRAEQAMAAGDVRQARLNIKVALTHDPTSEVLNAKLAEIDRRLTALSPSRRP